jgi:ribosomal protein S18 acetylase RimI-like enzyme
MPTSELSRTIAFRSSFARRQAARVTEVAGGFVVADPAYAHSYEHNQLVLDRPVDPGTVADQHLAPGHQQISVLDDLVGQSCAPVLTAAGYGHDIELVMVHTGPAPLPRGTAGDADPAALGRASGDQSRRWMPDADEAVIRHLVDRREARRRGAERVEFLADPAADGEPAAWCDLYLEPAQGIAQIEELVTAEAHLRRGHAEAVLGEALHRAAAAGCALRFLVADADDWPQHWYARRGFTVVGRSHRFWRQ